MRVALLVLCSAVGCTNVTIVQGPDNTSVDGAVDSGGVAETAVDAATDAPTTLDSAVDVATETPADLGTDGGSPTTDLLKPPRKTGKTATGKTVWFAVSTLKLGISTRESVVKPDAWKEYGYDLDGRATTKDESVKAATDGVAANSCRRRAGSTSAQLVDGPNGIDNNFGQFVMPIVKSLAADAEDRINNSVKDGAFTFILRIDNFTLEDNDRVPAALYVGNGTFTPKFDTTDRWPVNPKSLVDGITISKPKIVFPSGYVSAGVWVSGDGSADIDLGSIGSAPLPYPITSGVITMRTDGTFGTIAGAMNIKKAEDSLKPWARRLGICPGFSTYQQVVDTLAHSADLVPTSPMLQDTSRECDGISLAMGFTAKPTSEVTSTYTPGPFKDECPP